MERRLTEQDGRLALRDHILARAAAARARHGPVIDDGAIMQVLEDREVVRYPVRIRFDAEPLQPGEFAHAAPLGDHPRQGFCLFIHPAFGHRPETWPLVIAYHIAPVNYGDIASPDDCELFGATLLGLGREEYYQALCALADEVPA